MPARRALKIVQPVICEEDGAISLCFEDGIVQSRMSTSEPDRLVVEYTRLMMAFVLLHPQPRRIAMIGLGGGSLARYCRAHLRQVDITAVEIAPEVIAMRSLFGLPPDGRRFRVVCADGADFLHHSDDEFDVLLVDAFESGGQPASVGTVSFYDDCAARLAEGGVLVVNLHSDDDNFGTYVRRIRTAFDKRILVLSADESENRVLLASTAPCFPPPREKILERLHQLEADHPIDLAAAERKIAQYIAGRSAGRRGRRRAVR